MRRPYVIPHSESELNLPEGDQIILTQELIECCRTERGGYTSATIAAFGLTFETMQVGWPRRLIGKRLSRDQYRAALEGRYVYRSGRLRPNTPQPNLL